VPARPRSPCRRNAGSDSDLFGPFREGADSAWLLGTDSNKAIDLLKEVGVSMFFVSVCLYVVAGVGVWLLVLVLMLRLLGEVGIFYLFAMLAQLLAVVVVVVGVVVMMLPLRLLLLGGYRCCGTW